MPVEEIQFSDSNSPLQSCPACGDAGIVELEEFGSLSRVTSDCRAWPAGGRLAVCGACGLTFKPHDAVFRRDAELIYAGYSIYHQSGGREQRVRHPLTGELVPRSAVLAERLLAEEALPERGSLLDVGCGNGAFLRAFAAARAGWNLHGTEHDRRHAESLKKIPGFRDLLPGDALDAPHDSPVLKPGSFDLVTLIHVLEHVHHPAKWLARLKAALKPEGRLFIECPNAEINPFDLLTADHAMHFSPQTLQRIAAQAGLEIRLTHKAWIAKECSAVCRAAAAPAGPASKNPGRAADETVGRVRGQLAWLKALVTQARTLSAQKAIGCFGTSIAGTWLAQELKEKIGFFVDEDPDRAGTEYLGRPVLGPDRVAPGSVVLVALAPEVGEGVSRRLSSSESKVLWAAPPPLFQTLPHPASRTGR